MRESVWKTYDIGEFQPWEPPPQLCDPPNTTRADDAPLWQLFQTRVAQPFLDDEGVERVFAFEDSTELTTGRELGRDVFEAVHDRVDLFEE
jgi:hypothetical protein